MLGRVEVLNAGALALETRYVSDALGSWLSAWAWRSCHWRASRTSGGAPRSRPEPRSAGWPAAGLVGAFVIGSVWSVQDLQTTTSGLQTRLYIDNARVAVAQAPAHTVIADSQVPTTIMIGAFGQNADTSRVIGPMEDAAAKAQLRWTSSPHGTIDHLMVFGTDGRLRQAAIYGQTSAAPVRRPAVPAGRPTAGWSRRSAHRPTRTARCCASRTWPTRRRAART